MVTTIEDEQGEDGKDEQKRSMIANCCKKFLKFLFSHIGLGGMVIGYCVAGGFIFAHLEQTNEKQECVKAMDKYNPMANNTVNKLWEVAKTFCDDKDDDENVENAIKEITKLVDRFRDDVLELGYDGVNCTAMGEEGSGVGYQWSFPGALLFSVTVVTTIGKSPMYC